MIPQKTNKQKVQSCSTKKLYIHKLYVSFVLFPRGCFTKMENPLSPSAVEGEHFKYNW